MTERTPEQGFEEVAEAVADGTAVEWPRARNRLGDTGTLRGLQLLEQVGEVFDHARSAAETEASLEPPFEWGPLQVVERLDEGSFGVVFRAHDPHLGRDVALKLRKPSAAGDPSWLDEARRLARIRHEHVLTVHGAASHGDRDGFWCDLIDGETLSARLRRDGTLGALEIVAVGTTLCHALGAFHANGVVHGDVKAANVVREEGGRLVLIDLGAGHELSSAEASLKGSPRTAAPEVLRGEAPTPASDLYSLASLLFHLATGDLPTKGATWDQLADPDRPDPPPLGDRRPDLPAALTTAIDRGLAVDPRQRFDSAGAMERALLDAESTPPRNGHDAGANRRRYALGALLVVVVVLLAALGTIRTTPIDETVSAAKWVRATLVRVDLEPTAIDDGATIRPGDRLMLEIELDRAAHLYVANEDDAGNVFTLFPLPGGGLDNPLPAGRHHLPGAVDGRTQSWVVTSAGGRERFLIIAAARALPLAERFVRDAEAASAGRAIVSDDRVNERETLRGVGGVATSSRTDDSWLEDLRTRIHEEAEPGVWTRLIELHNPP